MIVRELGLFGLKKEFKFERQSERLNPLRYFDSQAQALATIKTNLEHYYVTSTGSNAHGEYIYVTLDSYQHIGIQDRKVHHSALSNGKKIRGAGVMTFIDGKLVNVSNESGHYKPTPEHMLPLLQYLIQESNDDKLVFEDHSRVKNTKHINYYYAKQVVANNGIEGLTPLKMKMLKKLTFTILERNSDEYFTIFDESPRLLSRFAGMPRNHSNAQLLLAEERLTSFSDDEESDFEYYGFENIESKIDTDDGYDSARMLALITDQRLIGTPEFDTQSHLLFFTAVAGVDKCGVSRLSKCENKDANAALGKNLGAK